MSLYKEAHKATLGMFTLRCGPLKLLCEVLSASKTAWWFPVLNWQEGSRKNVYLECLRTIPWRHGLEVVHKNANALLADPPEKFDSSMRLSEIMSKRCSPGTNIISVREAAHKRFPKDLNT